jgi:DNA-binding NtrC family response regulator
VATPSKRRPLPDDGPASPPARPLDVLLVEDDTDLRCYMAEVVQRGGHRVRTASDGVLATALVKSHVFDVVVSDVRLPRGDGRALLAEVRQQSPTTAFILVTAYGGVREAVAAVQAGAHDYLTKPFLPEQLLSRIERVARERAAQRELLDARLDLDGETPSGLPLVGRSPAIQRLRDQVGTLATSDAPVLLTGESGVGKELVAQTLHQLSPRRDAPFVAVNCAAFPETLLEAELFGHDRGAFTGAVKKRDGRFKRADRGTLLLDEVAEIPLPAQAKLLRVLQEGAIEPLGTSQPVAVDVRIVSATHRNLKERISQGLFREDLYYRLNVLAVEIPPLRERRSDVPLLLEHFLRRFAQGRGVPAVSPRAFAALCEHAYPGNVRELAHAIEHAVVLARGSTIDLEHLPADIAGTPSPPTGPQGELQPLALALRDFEREYLVRALAQAGGKRTEAARLLGISRKTLWEKLRQYGVDASGD